MVALSVIGALLTWGGAFTALNLYFQLRKLYGRKNIGEQVCLLFLMFFNNFVAAVGAALFVTDKIEEMQWHRTAIAFAISVFYDFVMTWSIILKPDPGKEPK